MLRRAAKSRSLQQAAAAQASRCLQSRGSGTRRLSTAAKRDLNPYGSPSRSRMLERAGSYDAVRQAFVMPTPKHYNIGTDMSDKHAGRRNDTAIIFEDETGQVVNCSYGQVIDLSNKLANVLVHKCGVQREDRVALLMSQSPETAISHIAAYKSGAICVPLFVLFGPDAIEYRLKDSGAKVVIVEPSSLETVLSLRKSLPNLKHVIVAPPLSAVRTAAAGIGSGKSAAAAGSDNVWQLASLLGEASSSFESVHTLADDPALIIYTSGTTGNPKGALHAHRTLLGHLPGVEYPQEFFPQPKDVFWTPADWAWIGGLIDVLMPSMHHGVPVLAQRFKKFDPDLAFRAIAKHKVRNMFMPPTALKLMRQVENPKSKYSYSVRSIGSGGETLGEGLLDWGRDTFGVTINEFYGQTESNLVLGNCASLVPVLPGSMGRPIPGHDVQIVDDDGKPLKQGEVGNIGIRAPHPVMFLRYWQKPEATKEKYAGGFLLTGDLGKMDADGYFWFFGRRDDVIKSAGYRIGPAEIEDCLIKHPAVLNAAVVGVPDPVRGENVKAFIVLRPASKCSQGSAEEKKLTTDIQTFVKSKLAAYEYPREVEFLEALPMTTTGKVIRRELRAMHIARKEAAAKGGK